MTSEDGPDIRILWDRRAKGRVAYRCRRCADEIPAGEISHSIGVIEDGAFVHFRNHVRAYDYPSGCPKLAPRDLAEIARQFEQDKALFPDDFGLQRDGV